MGREILFYCATAFQLFSIINLAHIFVKAGDKADIIIDNATNLEQYISKIKETQFFGTIYEFDYLGVQETWKKMNMEERLKISREPEKFINIEVNGKSYTDLYMGNHWAVFKLVYYMLISKGMSPRIHLFEDGTATYAINPEANYEKEGIDHTFYGDKCYSSGLQELMLYKPQLFAGTINCPITELPTVDKNSQELQDIYKKIFGETRLPSEKYIFFEEASFQDKYPCNDFELFELFAEKIGAENIIVKGHPRNRINRFMNAGYKVMENQTVPWEVTLMQNDVSDKVLVTITSGAVMTPYMIFDERVDSIHFVNMLQGYTPTTYHPEFYDFYEKIVEISNEEEPCVYSPASIKELDEVLSFILAKQSNFKRGEI